MKSNLQFIPKSFLITVIASVTVSLTALVANATEVLQLRLGTGRVIYFEYQKASKEGAPTFLLLPGVNRSLLMNEEGPQAILKKGYGVATMNFSVQPFSVNNLKTNEVPFFMNGASPSLQDLAAEAEAIARNLRTEKKVGTVIPVSLSYSGAVSPYLKGFAAVVETVPLTSAAAQNPQLEAYRNSLKMGEMWNPIFGPGITRSMLDQAYRSTWGDQVDAITKQFNLTADRSQMIEGYTTLSRATEGFAWDLSALPSGTRRVFMFAENEGKGLLEHQVSTFLTIYAKDAKAVLFVIKDSGHVIPSEQPDAYAGVLDLVAQGKTDQLGGVIEVDSAKRKSTSYQGKDAKAYLQKLVSKAE